MNMKMIGGLLNVTSQIICKAITTGFKANPARTLISIRSFCQQVFESVYSRFSNITRYNVYQRAVTPLLSANNVIPNTCPVSVVAIGNSTLGHASNSSFSVRANIPAVNVVISHTDIGDFQQRFS
jgi:hypothetical protein